MLAYIGGVMPLAVNDVHAESTLLVYFCGSDFKISHLPNAGMLEFKEEFISDLRDLRPELDVFVEKDKYVVIGGGEPLLQRAPFIYLCSYIHNAEGFVDLETNGSKPNVLREVLEKRMADRITLLLHSPLVPGMFQKVTKAGTFFKSAEEIITAVKQSVELLKRHQNDVEIVVRTHIVPSLLFKKEDIMEIASELEGLECRWELVPFNPEGVEDKKYSGLKPPTDEFLERLREAVNQEYPNLRVDIGEARILPSRDSSNSLDSPP